MSTQPKNKRLTTEQRAFVVNKLASGRTQSEIIEAFEAEFDRSIVKQTISKIRKQSQYQIETTAQSIEDRAISTAKAIKARSYTLIDSKLKRALADEDKLLTLRQRYLDSEITWKEYQHQLHGFTELTTNELVKIADTMHNHTKKDEDEAPSADRAALEALVEGIRSGNPVQLVQILNGSTSSGNPPASPPPVDL